MFEKNAVDRYVRINPETRLFEPVWMYRDILQFALGPDPAIVTGAISLTTAAPSKTVPYKLNHASLGYDDAVGNPLRINQISFTDTATDNENGAFSVFMTDMGDERQYMNYPIHCQTFAGTGQLSARLAEDLLLPTRHQLNLTFERLTDSDRSVNLILFGQSFDTWSSNLQKYTTDRSSMIKEIGRLLERRKYVTPYWLTTEGGVVSMEKLGQTVEVDTMVGSEGHIELTHIMRGFSTFTNDKQFEVEIINPQTRQSLMNGKLHSYLIGNAQNPQPLPAPLLVPAGQIIRFRITNLSNGPNDVYLTFRGFKIRAPFKSRAEVDREFGIATPVAQTKDRRAEMAGV